MGKQVLNPEMISINGGHAKSFYFFLRTWKIVLPFLLLWGSWVTITQIEASYGRSSLATQTEVKELIAQEALETDTRIRAEIREVIKEIREENIRTNVRTTQQFDELIRSTASNNERLSRIEVRLDYLRPDHADHQ